MIATRAAGAQASVIGKVRAAVELDDRNHDEGVSVNRSLLGLVIALAGALLLVLSVFADPIGIGVNEGYTFGWKQLLGTVAGIALVVTGYLVWRAAKAPSASRP
jgi:hypothetical protein